MNLSLVNKDAEGAALHYLNHEGLEKMTAECPALAYRFMYGLVRLLFKRLRRTSGLLAEHLVD